MIGKKVRVFWPVDESWYTGTVQKYDASTNEHLLVYQDGDEEWVKIGDLDRDTSTNTTSHHHHNNTATSTSGPSGTDPSTPGGGMPGSDPMVGGGPGGMMMGGPYGGYPPPPPPHGGPYGPPVYPPGMGGMPPPPHHHYHRMYPHHYHGAHPSMFPPGMGGGSHEEREDNDNALSASGKRKTGPKAWTKEEDALLLSIVKTMQMPMKWSIVAQSLPDRTGKQCRERYVNHLNPRLKVTDWNAMEDAMVFHLYNSIGSHWAKMSKIIPGRTDNGIKNRFHNLRRQFEREDEHRLRLSSTNEFRDAIRLERVRTLPSQLAGKASKLWDMNSGIGILAAQSVMGGSISRTKNRFGPFRKANPDGSDMCIRCGFMLPSLQTGEEICEKSGWCQTCTRIPPHISSNLLRECINLRREQNQDLRPIIESWEEYFAKGEEDKGEEDKEEEEGRDDDGDVSDEEYKKETETSASPVAAQE